MAVLITKPSADEHLYEPSACDSLIQLQRDLYDGFINVFTVILSLKYLQTFSTPRWNLFRIPFPIRMSLLGLRLATSPHSDC